MSSTVPPKPGPVADSNGTAQFTSSLDDGLKLRKMIVIALLAGALVFIIGTGFDWLLLRERESKTVTIEFSDALAGVVAAGLMFRLLQYERERRERLRQKLEVIAQMNHHIRNALQVISFSAFSTADQKQLEAIRESVQRIQWALKEILPKI